MESKITQQVERVFRRIFKDDSLLITRASKASDIDMWDSLTHMELIAEIEAEMGYEFTYEQVSSFSNVGDMIDVLVTRSNS